MGTSHRATGMAGCAACGAQSRTGLGLGLGGGEPALIDVATGARRSRGRVGVCISMLRPRLYRPNA
jgi:hypothetical protein